MRHRSYSEFRVTVNKSCCIAARAGENNQQHESLNDWLEWCLKKGLFVLIIEADCQLQSDATVTARLLIGSTEQREYVSKGLFDFW